MAQRQPAEVFCLAEFLCEEMQARGWRTEDVAVRMGGDVKEIGVNLLSLDLLMCVQDDKLLVGDQMFDGLARAFDVSPELFRNLDRTWRDAAPDRRSPFTAPESIFGPISRRSLIHAVEKKD